jgi:dTDP-glucose 4,6-dehydratase
VQPQPESYWGQTSPDRPPLVYDEAKRFAEAMVMAYHRYHGVETRIVRIFNTYGPRMRPNDGRVVPAFIVQALKGEPMTVFGDGRQTRSFCYVSDLIAGIFALMMSATHEPVKHRQSARNARDRVCGENRALCGSSSPISTNRCRGRPESAAAEYRTRPQIIGLGAA